MPRIPETLAPLAVDIASLKPYDGNPRRGNLTAIKESLKAHGQYRPVVVRRETGEVLAGNHTLAAAKSLGWKQIAATFVECDDDQARRIVLVDNRTNDIAGYDDEALAELLRSLDGDFTGTGWTDAAANELLAISDEPIQLTEPDDTPALSETPTICQPGDIFDLGDSMLLVGDSTDSAAVVLLLAGEQAYTVWTDPPYGVDYVGKTDAALTIQNDAGTNSLPELLSGAFSTITACSRPGAAVYVAHADANRLIFETAMREAGIRIRQNLIWVKNAISLCRADYQYQHEPILYGLIAGGGRGGRGSGEWFGDHSQSTVFEIPKPHRNSEHPTMKPVALIRAMLANSTPQGGLVLDVFAGSGSTLIAAYDARMRAAVVELDPRYADVICRRWEQHTGIVPVRRSDGATVSFAGGQ